MREQIETKGRQGRKMREMIDRRRMEKMRDVKWAKISMKSTYVGERGCVYYGDLRPIFDNILFL